MYYVALVGCCGFGLWSSEQKQTKGNFNYAATITAEEKEAADF